jgi:hypothetical protein
VTDVQIIIEPVLMEDFLTISKAVLRSYVYTLFIYRIFSYNPTIKFKGNFLKNLRPTFDINLTHMLLFHRYSFGQKFDRH